MAGAAVNGTERRVSAWQAWHGAAGRGVARIGAAGMAVNGKALNGLARTGLAWHNDGGKLQAGATSWE
jgi:hypothetical protein